ncbi:MAG: phosphoglucosamine mutase [Ruminococcaceae bacterium]|nr:phosphoglucosamine mutase [Oscillospiraceae bacterium]
MGKLFGTDGVRGIANCELTPQLAFQIGQAGAYVLTKHLGDGQATILVGKDTRISGDMLEAALTAGICSVGGRVVSLGVIPTPGVAYLTKKYKADAGVVISASHNPMEYNGIKFFNQDGFKLNDEIELEIEGHIFHDNKEIPLAKGADMGICNRCEQAISDYSDFICSSVPLDLTGKKIVVDCANGASFVAAEKVFSQMGADLTVIYNQPDGTNINANCGSTHMESLCQKVKEVGADVGFAFDGDADRCLAVDEKGNIVNGDVMMMICASFLKKQGKLKNNTLVATVMSNLGLFIAAEKQGITVLKTKVGDRYVLEEMRAGGHCIGGEQSGHVIYLDYNSTGDGLLSAVMMLKVMTEEGKSLSELSEIVHILPQALCNAKVKNEYKETFAQDPEIAAAIKALEEKFAGEGRILIRPSGTEPLVRVMIEGNDIEEINRDAKMLADMIQSRFA